MEKLITVKSLRIGNWINTIDDNKVFRPGKVGGITSKGVLVEFDDKKDPPTKIEKIAHKLTPVSLTKEWLSKAHFRTAKTGEDFERFYFGSMEITFLDTGDIIPTYQTSILPVCKYVHVLQNLYRALSGEELWL